MKMAFSLLLIAALVAVSCTSTSWADTRADELFQKALAAEQTGNYAQRNRLLSDALKADPDHRLARWYSGHVLHNGQWRDLDTIAHTVSTDPRWQEYQDLIESSEDTLADHVDVARWCRTKGLDLEAKWHWIHVLRHDPGNREALGALGLRVFRGGYATPEQIAAIETEEKKAKVAFKHYAELLKDAMREAERTDGSTRLAALKKISGVNDPAAIAAIVEIVLADAKNENRILEKLGRQKGESLLREMQFAAIAALASIPEHEATESLVEIALFASDRDVREEAARKLQPRDPTSFIPQLMAGLSAPIELEVSVHTLPNGEITVYEDFTEKGPLTTRKHSRSSSFLTQHVNILTNRREAGGSFTSPTRIASVWSEQWRDMANAAAQVASTQDRVELENALRNERNARIERVLELACGKALGEDAEAWWNDWQDYNELYTPEYFPVAETQEYVNNSRYIPHYVESRTGPVRETKPYIKPAPEDMPYRLPRSLYGRVISLYRPMRRVSCFAAGTAVWTQSGPVAIEKVRIGDLVLSQSPYTGELNYRPVIDATVRPPSGTIKLGVNGKALVATRGHRFWIAGEGWRMAKFLKPADSILTLSGSAKLQLAEKGEDVEAFNLEVGEFHTYFVGENRVLVHDGTCPMPTINILPGISPRSEVARAQLAMQ